MINRSYNKEMMKMKKVLIAAGAVFALSTGIMLDTASQAATPSPQWMTTPCAQEDSSNCYWDANAAGDHRGHSFYSIRVGDQDCIVYWDNRYAKHHNYCI